MYERATYALSSYKILILWGRVHSEILILMFVKEGMHLYTLDSLCTVLKEIRLLSSFHLKVDLRSRGKVIRKESVEHKKEESFHNLQIFFLALEMVKKNSTKTNEIFSSNFQMT